MKYRIGVDVGGTFTDAVVLDAHSHEVIGYVKVPTTHSHPKSVSEGIKNAIEKLIENFNIDIQNIDFIAHGTTQVTNALLEGDVSPVSVISTAKGFWAFRVKDETKFISLPLAAGKKIHVDSYFIKDFEKNYTELENIHKRILRNDKKFLVSSSAYSVDDPILENAIKTFFKEKGYSCTASHEMSSLYGLRTRTKTAIINASVMSKMLETTNFMLDSIKSTGIKKPLMIMRSDGGVMDANEVSRRPIQTIMSGPASGVSGAILHAKISEGIFLEVGGTSTDISVIHNGRVMVKWAQIGSLKTYTPSLDIRTVAIAGGSILRLENDIVICGPRSAHIASLEYVCFSKNIDIDSIVIRKLQSKEDNVGYIVVHDSSTNKDYALTLTCLANYFGYVSSGDFAKSENICVIEAALKCLSKYLDKSIEKIGSEVFSYTSKILRTAIMDLLASYHLKISEMILVGGGGGASAIVPMLSEYINIKMQPIKNAHIISPIGVAISMVREVVERSLQNPSKRELEKLQEEAIQLAVRSGASLSKIEVDIEVDPKKNIVRAIASGVTENTVSYKADKTVTTDIMIDTILKRNNFGPIILDEHIESQYFDFFVYKTESKNLFQKIFKKKKFPLYILSKDGFVRFVKEQANLIITKKENAVKYCNKYIDKYSTYNDAGECIPDVFMILHDKIYDYSQITSREQLITLVAFEVAKKESSKDIYFVFCE